MVAYRLSGRVAADLDEIYEYTIVNFGLVRARDYLVGLHEIFGRLLEHPFLGRGAARILPKLRRYEFRFHVMFYVP